MLFNLKPNAEEIELVKISVSDLQPHQEVTFTPEEFQDDLLVESVHCGLKAASLKRVLISGVNEWYECGDKAYRCDIRDGIAIIHRTA